MENTAIRNGIAKNTPYQNVRTAVLGMMIALAINVYVRHSKSTVSGCARYEMRNAIAIAALPATHKPPNSSARKNLVERGLPRHTTHSEAKVATATACGSKYT